MWHPSSQGDAVTTPIALFGGLAISLLGLFAGFAVTHPAAPALGPAPDALEQPGAEPQVLAQLGLDAAQAEQIDALRARETRRVEALQRALADAEDSLRRAELEIPFDAVRVNELVALQAELVGLLRGTESRVVAEIAAILEPEQQRRFAELRSGTAAPEAPEILPPAREEEMRGGGI
jgi:Spy/CpxP family protein refolding chaperone